MENNQFYNEEEVLKDTELMKKLYDEVIETYNEEENGEKQAYIMAYLVEKGKSGRFVTIENTEEAINTILNAKENDCFFEYYEDDGNEEDDSTYEGELCCLADSTRNFLYWQLNRNIKNASELRQKIKGSFLFVARKGENYSDIFENFIYERYLREQFEF